MELPEGFGPDDPAIDVIRALLRQAAADLVGVVEEKRARVRQLEAEISELEVRLRDIAGVLEGRPGASAPLSFPPLKVGTVESRDDEMRRTPERLPEQREGTIAEAAYRVLAKGPMHIKPIIKELYGELTPSEFVAVRSSVASALRVAVLNGRLQQTRAATYARA